MTDLLLLAADASVPTTDAVPKVGYGAILALIFFVVGSVWISMLANHATRSGSFMQGFFLGNRGLGSWALALTATVQSGGTFMGFPSFVYSHGWVVALWICGYMVVPITGFGILGKRIAQLSRMTGAITVPDLFRARFQSPTLGLVASLFIIFFMTTMMIAQFKAGATVMKLSFPGTDALVLAEDAAPTLDRAYYIGLAVFSITVIGYTLLGGFLAAVWTDLFQSIMMWIGVTFLLFLAISASGGPQAATETIIANPNIGAAYAFAPGFNPSRDAALAGNEFLPLSIAASLFGLWVFTGLGSPAGMVRIMACKDTGTIRRSIYLLAIYNAGIYLPLVIICVCGRAILPNIPAKLSDEIIPRLALHLTADFPAGSFLAGMILAAPFGAVMATVSSYLVVIASGLVRDIYQRFINPQANEYQLSRMSYLVMGGVGLVAILASIKPVQFLQVIVVFSGSGAAATFMCPALMMAFWRRTTVPGMLSGMLSGAATVVSLYLIEILRPLLIGSLPSLAEPLYSLFPKQLIGPAATFRAYYLFGVDPLIWGLLVSGVAGVVVSLLTKPPKDEVVSRFFEVRVPTATA
jgi:sodium/pantothenate symporter